MAHETETTPGPLTASVVEQLREKAQLEAASEAAADDAERERERTDRRKAEEQETVLRHTGGELRVKPPTGERARDIELREGRARAWLRVAAIGGALAGLGLTGRGVRAIALAALGACTVVLGVALRAESAVAST